LVFAEESWGGREGGREGGIHINTMLVLIAHISLPPSLPPSLLTCHPKIGQLDIRAPSSFSLKSFGV